MVYPIPKWALLFMTLAVILGFALPGIVIEKVVVCKWSYYLSVSSGDTLGVAAYLLF